MRVFEDTSGFVRRCMCVTCEVCVCKCAHLNMDNKIYDKANGGGGGVGGGGGYSCQVTNYNQAVFAGAVLQHRFKG